MGMGRLTGGCGEVVWRVFINNDYYLLVLFIYLLLICNRYAPYIIRKLKIYIHIICNSTITAAPGHEHGYNGL